MRKQTIKTLYRKHRAPRLPGEIYWEDLDDDGFYRLPTAAEWESCREAFKAIEPPNPNDDDQQKRWRAHDKSYVKGDTFKIDREQLERDEGVPLKKIPMQKNGHPYIGDVLDELHRVIFIYGWNVKFWRGASK